MAEKIVSAGVFTNEKDLSFLPQGISEIGAAFVGPTIKGPAMIPTTVTSFGEFTQIFGDTNPNLYLPYAAKEYLINSGQLTVVRTLHDDGYAILNPLAIVATGSYGTRHIGLLHPSQVISEGVKTFYNGTDSLFHQSALTNNVSGSFVFNLSGSYQVNTDANTGFPNVPTHTNANYSASLYLTNANYLSKVFSLTPQVSNNAAYLYTFFPQVASASLSADANTTIILQSGSAALDFQDSYQAASTPWIISQTVNNTNEQLFKFHTISTGVNSNYEIKVAITNIKPAGSVAGSEYGAFSVVIRAVDQTKLTQLGSPFATQDSDVRPNILESYDNVNLDPNSPRYVARIIGDRYKTFKNGKVIINGDYSNKSKYVYVEVESTVAVGSISNQLVPFGFAALTSPLSTVFTQPASASLVSAQRINGIFNRRKHFGFDFDFAATDNANYLKPVPKTAATAGNNAKFLLSDFNQDSNYTYSGSIDLVNASSDSRKFIVPFQGGSDGIQPNRRVLVGANIVAGNTQGYDLSTNTSNDYSVYTNAIDSVSNPDELDINMLVLPGVTQESHSAIIDYAANMCLDRADTFFVFDCVGLTSGIDAAVSSIEAMDNNYAATYFPWVKIMDNGINKPVWVPPSVVIPGVLSFNDKVAAEWYAPAGLNRGGLTSVLDAYSRLTHAERDTLYEGRINPIATFPAQGVCVWGQKTLQAKPSALDRINVRRMLIAVKKFIASATKYLVFENNTAVTRNRFLNICNPYLESVQSRQGLYGFKVVMDETNNTPDIIDRNIMYGQIYLQPAKTAEFIIIDFNILPTGAAFPGA